MALDNLQLWSSRLFTFAKLAQKICHYKDEVSHPKSILIGLQKFRENRFVIKNFILCRTAMHTKAHTDSCSQEGELRIHHQLDIPKNPSVG